MSDPNPQDLNPQDPKSQDSKPSAHKSESGFQYSLSNLKPAQPLEKITITFPDGARRDFPKNTTGLDIAKGISPSLAKRTVAMALNGDLADLNDPISDDAKIEFVSREEPRALETGLRPSPDLFRRRAPRQPWLDQTAPAGLERARGYFPGRSRP